MLSDYVVFTDGFFPDPRELGGDRQPRVGWLVLERETGASFCGSWNIPEPLLQKWLPRRTQIVMIEAFAAVLVIEGFRFAMSDKKVLLFVDSEPVQAALIKGYSSKDDLCSLVGLFWELCAEASIAIYVDRVPTDTNPSDGASRGDLGDLVRAGALRIAIDPSERLESSDPAGCF